MVDSDNENVAYRNYKNKNFRKETVSSKVIVTENGDTAIYYNSPIVEETVNQQSVENQYDSSIAESVTLTGNNDHPKDNVTSLQVGSISKNSSREISTGQASDRGNSV